MNAPQSVLLHVLRSGPADQAPRYDQFRVPAGPRTTVLDALLAVRRHQDPSLTIRHSCLHGSCGSCGLRVNGREALACVTRLDGLGDPVVVEPLAGMPVVGDLVVDMEGLYRRLEPAGRPLVRASEQTGSGASRPAATGPQLDELERLEDCVECGLCLSACPVAGDDRFLGPTALAAAERVLAEPRGADPRAVRKVRGPSGSRLSACESAVERPPPTPTATRPRSRTAVRSSRHCPEEAARASESPNGSAAERKASDRSSQQRFSPELTGRPCQIGHGWAKFRRAGPRSSVGARSALGGGARSALGDGARSALGDGARREHPERRWAATWVRVAPPTEIRRSARVPFHR